MCISLHLYKHVGYSVYTSDTGRVLSGFITVFIFLFILFRLIYHTGIIQDPYRIGLSGSSFVSIILMGIALILYVFSNLNLRKLK